MVAVQLRQQQRNAVPKKIPYFIYFLTCYLCRRIATLLEIIITLPCSRLTTRIKGQQTPQQFVLYLGLKTMDSFKCNRKNHSDWPNSPEGPDPLHWVGKTSCGPWRSGWAWSILKVSSWPPAPHSRPGPRSTCSFLRWSPWTGRGDSVRGSLIQVFIQPDTTEQVTSAAENFCLSMGKVTKKDC